VIQGELVDAVRAQPPLLAVTLTMPLPPVDGKLALGGFNEKKHWADAESAAAIVRESRITKRKQFRLDNKIPDLKLNPAPPGKVASKTF
jgi:hypothetical protein